jgi:hypothetical protein
MGDPDPVEDTTTSSTGYVEHGTSVARWASI